MFHPVNPGWKTRPGWSEFGAPRPNGAWRTHRGFDYYVPRGTPIFASGDGTVVSVGYNASGYGHYCTVRYAQYTILVGHFLARPTVSVGQRVNARTQLGVVGQSGNAAGIQWNGLIHPHVEVRPLSGGVIDPLSVLSEFDRSSLAGGSGTPIPLPEEKDDDMSKPRIIQAFGLPDTAVIGGGMAYTFPNASELTTLRNVERETNPDIDKTQTVGDAGMSEDTRRALLQRIVNIYASAQGVQNTLAAVRQDITRVPGQSADAVDAKIAPRFDSIPAGGPGDASFTSEDRSILQQIRSFFRA